MAHKKMRSTTAITLRNLPPEVERAIRARAKERGISLNKAVVGLLEERIGAHGRKKRYDDLDAFAGSWTKEEAEEFDRALADQRRPEPELWKA